MKNFHFNISKFSSIFGAMSGSGKNNIDSFLDEQFRLSMQSDTPEGFEDELMKRISIENEFRKEDVKTEKFAKSVIFFCVFSFLAVVILAGYVLGVTDSPSEGRFTGFVETFSEWIGSFSMKLTSIFGLGSGLELGAAILFLALTYFMYSLAEKFVLKRNSQR